MSLTEDSKSTPVLAVDTGGTFTDFLLQRDGHLTVLKVPSTPENPSLAILAGLRQLLGEQGGALRLIHGSTVATNALLERKGARVALLTNAGLEDIIEIGRQDRPHLYALSGSRSTPLVDAPDRFGVAGRLDANGTQLLPLDAGELARLPGLLEGAEAVAVVLLHSYANPEHEDTVAGALSELGIPISLSSRILPEFREYERTSTTVANAYVAPRMGRYLAGLGDRLGDHRIAVMGSSGGTLPLSRAIAEPVHTVLSGPAGGVVAALEWGRRCGWDHLLSLDMGGTSTDVSLIPGHLMHTREGRVGDIPIAIPLLDIHTVGAGGGSIARVDPGGVLRVGPWSAGAVPGPVAYGEGGTEVTVTDANFWLGRIPATGLLGGTRPLDRAALEDPLATLAARAGVSPDQLAEGIIDVVNTAMAGALRVISVERGIDPSDFALLAFGGAAGLHAAELADRVGLGAVIIPPEPGLLSAFGMLVSPIVRDRSRTIFLSSDDPRCDVKVRTVLDDLEAGARQELAGEGANPANMVTDRWVDARYRDQSFEIRVSAEEWVERFQEAHRERYGYRREGVAVEAVTARVQVRVPANHVATDETITGIGPEADTGADGEAVTGASVTIVGQLDEVPVLPRTGLRIGEPVPGPIILTEYSSTTWCPPGWLAEAEASGALRLSRAGPS